MHPPDPVGQTSWLSPTTVLGRLMALLDHVSVEAVIAPEMTAA
jgi:hypothetical protein